MSPSKRQHHWALWAAAAVILIAGGIIIFHHPAPKKAPPAPGVPVAVAAVKTGDIDIYLNALGTVTPISTVTVTSRVAGELVEIHYQEGQIVKKGDLLAVIDPRPYEAALTQASGQLARDRALLKNAQIDEKRYESALQQHAIPEQQLATQQATVEGDEGTVKVDEGNEEAARVNVDYTRITSPIDGRAGLRLTDLGNIVAANGTTGLVTLTQLQPITVIFTLAEDDLDQVLDETRAGHILQVDAFDRTAQTKIAQGTLLTLDNSVNPTTGTIRAKAVFPNAKFELFPNQFVNAKLYVKKLTGVDLIPTAAIQRNNDTAFVFALQPDSTVKTQTIKLTTTDGDTSAVTGLNPGDRVVTDGFDKLQNGSKISLRTPAPATAPAPAAGSHAE